MNISRVFMRVRTSLSEHAKTKNLVSLDCTLIAKVLSGRHEGLGGVLGAMSGVPRGARGVRGARRVPWDHARCSQGGGEGRDQGSPSGCQGQRPQCFCVPKEVVRKLLNCERPHATRTCPNLR